MSVSKEVKDLAAEVERAPGWRVEDHGNRLWIYPPAGDIVRVSKHDQRARSLANVRAALRRAGLAADDGPASEGIGPDGGPAEVVERAPAGAPGVEELLLDDGMVVYGCATCPDARFEDLPPAAEHQAVHGPGPGARDRVVEFLSREIDAGRYPSGLPSALAIASKLAVSPDTARAAIGVLAGRGVVRVIPGEGAFVAPPTRDTTSEETPTVANRSDARLNGGPGHEMTNEDVVDLLARAAGLVQRVAAGVAARPDHGARVADLERQVAEARVRVAELEDRIAAMQEAARCLLGGRS